MHAARITDMMKDRTACVRILTWILLSTVLLIFGFMFGPMDIFTHGYICKTVDPADVDAEDFRQFIDLTDGPYEFKFTPEEHHFRGFALYMDYSAEEKTGTAAISITDADGLMLDETEVDLSSISSYEQIAVYMDTLLQKGKEYFCSIEVYDTSGPVYIMTIDGDYLGKELEGDNILVGFLYAESTFSFSEKVLLILLLAAFWLAVSGKFFLQTKTALRSSFYLVSVALAMVFLLSWNYMFNTMDSGNENFDGAFDYSEFLVIGPIIAQGQGMKAPRQGLAFYSDAMGDLMKYGLEYYTDDNWTHGYSNTEAQIRIANTEFSLQTAVVGNYIEFANSEIYQITAIEELYDDLIITLNADRHLNYYKYGELSWVKYYDSEMNPLSSGELYGYSSQFGLQGKIFRHLAAVLGGGDYLEYFHLICAVAAAVVFTGIVLLLKLKYNILMGGCFFVTFLLSPWIVNFARNLYWMEFTWFLPMLVGLICTILIRSRKGRMACYAAAFLTITFKCLCGYEYITSVMLGLIAFPLADLFLTVRKKNREDSLLLLRTVVIMGIAALLGFAAALLLHANLIGEGNPAEGLSYIQSVSLRRTSVTGNTTEYVGTMYEDSTTASIWETILLYLNFNINLSTEIITGIPGNLFPLLCLVPIALFLFEYRDRDLHEEEPALYVIFLCMTLSWFVLGKAHSYVHTHLNFVLWYYGFVQICFYIILRPLKDMTEKLRRLPAPDAKGAETNGDS